MHEPILLRFVFDACDSEMGGLWRHAAAHACFDWTCAAGSEVAQFLCNSMWQTDRQTDVTDWAAGFCWRACCVSLQDGLVQAAALWEGFQCLLHQDRHQKGSQVSDGRMHIRISFIRKVCKHTNNVSWYLTQRLPSFFFFTHTLTCATAAGMWLSRLEGHRFDWLNQSVPKKKKMLLNKMTGSTQL